MIYSPLAPGRLIDLVETLRRSLPEKKVVPFTPSDTADVPFAPSHVYAAAGGNARIRMRDGSEATIVLLEGLNPMTVPVVRILSTGTTAQIVAISG